MRPSAGLGLAVLVGLVVELLCCFSPVGQATQDLYGERDFQYITALHHAWSSPPTPEELVEFATEYDHRTVPALSVPEEDQTYPESELWRLQHQMAGGWVVHIGKGARVVSIGEDAWDPEP